MLKNNKGFTLLQIVIVIAIIAILSAVAVASFANLPQKAEDTMLTANAKILATTISTKLPFYENENWYIDSVGINYDCVNDDLEAELEMIKDGHYSNANAYKNPVSSSEAILDYSNTLGSGDGYCPAVFMTQTAAYAHTGKGSTGNLIGSVVAYFHADGSGTDYVEVYYVKRDGSKSDVTFKLNGTQQDADITDQKIDFSDKKPKDLAASPYQ